MDLLKRWQGNPLAWPPIKARLREQASRLPNPSAPLAIRFYYLQQQVRFLAVMEGLSAQEQDQITAAHHKMDKEKPVLHKAAS